MKRSVATKIALRPTEEERVRRIPALGAFAVAVESALACHEAARPAGVTMVRLRDDDPGGDASAAPGATCTASRSTRRCCSI